jgi:protein-L-isoaspartate(D-aspartate) O-methyltransferase
MRFEDQRKRLIKELETFGIKDQKVLSAFQVVPRERFVLPQYLEYSYQNQPLPIEQNQTISQPLMIAIMLEHLQLDESDIVLEIGTGSGYQTALLASVVKEVCTVERIDVLSLRARNVLNALGYSNVYYKIGDGSKGWQKAYPPYNQFSKIIVSAAADSVPENLVNQLSEPGILVIPVGGQYMQNLIKITKDNGQITQTTHGGCTFVPLIVESQ